MKKYRLLALLLLLGLAFGSCNKKTVWNVFFGYSIQDVIGTYGPSNVVDAFDGLTESDLCHICSDAQITIANVGGRIRLDFKSVKAGMERSYTGNPILNDDDFLLQLGDIPGYHVPEVLATVYTNEKQEIRLHGYVRKLKSSTLEGPVYINYYFDVVTN